MKGLKKIKTHKKLTFCLALSTFIRQPSFWKESNSMDVNDEFNEENDIKTFSYDEILEQI
jgi:hypothetical protein